MTIQGALSDLDNLLEADDIPFYYKTSIKKKIETIEQEPKTDCILIPDDATNGDVFTIMFNKTFPKTIVMYKNDESRLTINPIFSREWWEMPYQSEVSE